MMKKVKVDDFVRNKPEMPMMVSSSINDLNILEDGDQSEATLSHCDLNIQNND